MPLERTGRLVCLLLPLLVAQGRAQQLSPPSAWATQGTFGVGGGPPGLVLNASLGPRYRSNLLSLRGTAAFVLDPLAGYASTTLDWGLTYGRVFCSGDLCVTPVVGGGGTTQEIDDALGQNLPRQSAAAFFWEVRLVGRIGQTTGLGLTVLGDQNSIKNFWAVTLTLQPGLPHRAPSAHRAE